MFDIGREGKKPERHRLQRYSRKPRNTGNLKPKEIKNRFFSKSLWKEFGPTGTLFQLGDADFGILVPNSNRTHFCSLKPLSLWLLQQSTGTAYKS